MRYGKLEGPIYCRYAKTSSIINSVLAREIGVEAPLGYRPEYGFRIEAGRNVKLRMMLDNRKRRMTCHAKIDRVREDAKTGEHIISFSHLSLSEDEFKVLMASFTEEEVPSVAFGETVRDATCDSIPLAAEGPEALIRDKAVTMPVSLIDLIDEKRGEVSFSAFVVAALTEKLRA